VILVDCEDNFLNFFGKKMCTNKWFPIHYSSKFGDLVKKKKRFHVDFIKQRQLY